MRKTLIKALAGVTVFGTIIASASTLGGLTPDSMGAQDAVIAACDTNGVATSQTSAWDGTDKRYEVGTVIVKDVADTCDGKTLKVTLADGTGAALGEGTLTIPAGTETEHQVTLTAPASTEDVQNIHVNIS